MECSFSTISISSNDSRMDEDVHRQNLRFDRLTLPLSIFKIDPRPIKPIRDRVRLIVRVDADGEELDCDHFVEANKMQHNWTTLIFSSTDPSSERDKFSLTFIRARTHSAGEGFTSTKDEEISSSSEEEDVIDESSYFSIVHEENWKTFRLKVDQKKGRKKERYTMTAVSGENDHMHIYLIRTRWLVIHSMRTD